MVSDILDAGVASPGHGMHRVSRIPHSGCQDPLTAGQRLL